MGKKSKILYYSVLIVNLTCFILDLIPGINFPFFRISFAASLILIGILLITRALTLKIDSSMFIGAISLQLGILNILLYFGQLYKWLTVLKIVPYYLFAVAIASLVTGIYFKDKLQLKLTILFTGFGVITLLFSLNVLLLGWYIAIMVIWFVVYFIANLLIYKKRSR